MEMTRKRAEGQPKYRAIQSAIRARIDDGRLYRGEKLRSTQDLARDFGVSYLTMCNALAAMVEEGLLHRIHGKGTFVAGGERPAAVKTLVFVVPSLPVLCNVPGFYYFPPIVQGFSAEASRLGYEPTVIGGAHDALRIASGELPGVSGFACLLVLEEDQAFLEALRDRGVPTIGINAYRGRRAISFVAADQETGIVRAVGMLVRKGHRHIAFLPGPKGNLGAREREKGFRRAAREYDFAPIWPPEEGWAGDTRIQSAALGAYRTRQLLATPRPPTAIIAAGDVIAMGVLQALDDAGITVPEEMSVVGFGDFHVAQHLRPGLTTVRLPMTELGAKAAALLHESATGTTGRRTIFLETDMVERDSVSLPRDKVTPRPTSVGRG